MSVRYGFRSYTALERVTSETLNGQRYLKRTIGAMESHVTNRGKEYKVLAQKCQDPDPSFRQAWSANRPEKSKVSFALSIT